MESGSENFDGRSNLNLNKEIMDNLNNKTMLFDVLKINYSFMSLQCYVGDETRSTFDFELTVEITTPAADCAIPSM